MLPALGVLEAIHKLNGASEAGLKSSEKNPANIVNSENSDSDKKNEVSQMTQIIGFNADLHSGIKK